MDRNQARKANRRGPISATPELPSSLRVKYSITIIFLTILSALNISLKSEEISSNDWSFSLDLQVTTVTLALLVLFWIPILLPWILYQIPQVKGSLNWLREQGIEEVETNLLRIKLKYGVQQASENYAEKISDSNDVTLAPQDTQQQIATYYRDAIALVDAANNVGSLEALQRVDQLVGYYDRLREKMPSGHNRTRLLREISSIMWTLVPKVRDFPVYERLSSKSGGERLSAYKYIEWSVSTEHIDLLVSRAVGILEVPFTHYAALLTLRRIAASNQLTPSQSAKIIDSLNGVKDLIYVYRHTRKLMLEIISILGTKT